MGKQKSVEETIKDERLSAQLGSFGESLTLFLLGHRWGYRVATVDHVGADIIATPRVNGEKTYAISVKSRRFVTDDMSQEFDETNQKHLRQFASEFNMVPAVCWILIQPATQPSDDEIIDVYLLTLETFENLSAEGKKEGFTLRGKEKSSLTISNAHCNQSKLQSLPNYIAHARLTLSIKNLETDWLTLTKNPNA